jgi:hypothetical protein
MAAANFRLANLDTILFLGERPIQPKIILNFVLDSMPTLPVRQSFALGRSKRND